MPQRILISACGVCAIFFLLWILTWTTCNMDDFYPTTCSVTASGAFRDTFYGFVHFPLYLWAVVKIIGTFIVRLWRNFR